MVAPPQHPSDELAQQIAAYRVQLSEALDGVQQLLARNEYESACRLMSQVSQLQGKAAVSMRNILVKNGHITEDDE